MVNLAFEGVTAGPAGPVLLPAAEGFRAAWLCKGQSKAAEYAPEGTEVVTAVFSGPAAGELLDYSDHELVGAASADSDRVYGTGRLGCRVDAGRQAHARAPGGLTRAHGAGQGADGFRYRPAKPHARRGLDYQPYGRGRAISSGERAAESALALEREPQ